jgi:hypothetical protein
VEPIGSFTTFVNSLHASFSKYSEARCATHMFISSKLCIFHANSQHRAKEHMKRVFVVLLLAGCIAGCKEDEPNVPEQQKDNLVENRITYHNYKDSVTFHQVTRIFVHAQLVRVMDTTYTLPSPGNKTVLVEDADGNEKDTTVTIPYGISFNAKEVQ